MLSTITLGYIYSNLYKSHATEEHTNRHPEEKKDVGMYEL